MGEEYDDLSQTEMLEEKISEDIIKQLVTNQAPGLNNVHSGLLKEFMYGTAEDPTPFHNFKHTLASVPEMLSVMPIFLNSCRHKPRKSVFHHGQIGGKDIKEQNL